MHCSAGTFQQVLCARGAPATARKFHRVNCLQAPRLSRPHELTVLSSYTTVEQVATETSTDAQTIRINNDATTISPRAVKEGIQLPPMLNCAVKIFATWSRPNWSLPWQKQKQKSATMSGFIIDCGQQLIITSACYLEYSSRVQVKKQGDDTKYTASVVAIGVDTDIALLAVNSPEFWKGTCGITWGSLPHLRDKVIVVGYPVGGSTVSVTEGVVSRIELTNCQNLHDYIVGVQIDAAINSGNEGGPVFNAAGELVGMAAYSLGGSTENIGYVIPTQVIQHVLKDFQQHGFVLGQPSLGPIEYQPVESAALRKELGLTKHQQGVLVRRVATTAPASALIEKHDVILSADGVNIAGDGTVAFRGNERMSWVHLIKQKYVGDVVSLEILRDGQQLIIDVPLSVPSTANSLIPPHLNNKDPSYVIVGGLVFVACTLPYLKWVYGSGGDFRSRAPVKLLDKCFHGQRQAADEQIVVLSQILACEGTSGYETLLNDLEVKMFNGCHIRNLKHLVTLVQANKEPSLRFELEHHHLVVIDADVAARDTAIVMRSHNIAHAMSADLRATFQGHA